MTPSIEHRPLFTDEIAYEIGHFMLFGAIIWFCLQEGDTLFAAGAALYLVLNVARLGVQLKRGVERPFKPVLAQMVAHGVSVLIGLGLVYAALFHIEEVLPIESLVAGAGILVVMGSGSILLRGLRGAGGAQ